MYVYTQTITYYSEHIVSHVGVPYLLLLLSGLSLSSSLFVLRLRPRRNGDGKMVMMLRRNLGVSRRKNRDGLRKLSTLTLTLTQFFSVSILYPICFLNRVFFVDYRRAWCTAVQKQSIHIVVHSSTPE